MIPPIKISITTDQLIGLLNLLKIDRDIAAINRLDHKNKSMVSIVYPLYDSLHVKAARWQSMDSQKILKARYPRTINHTTTLKYHEAYTLSNYIKTQIRNSDIDVENISYEENCALIIMYKIDKEL